MYKIKNNIYYSPQRNSESISNVIDSIENIKTIKKSHHETICSVNKNSKLQLLVIDNFYKNPIEVRNVALAQEINIEGNFPGHRTIPFASNELKQLIQSIVKPFGIVDNFHTYINGICDISNDCNCFNGSFFLNTAYSKKQWIHRDRSFYSAIIYLTPDPPLYSGTSLYKLKQKYENEDEYGIDKTKWNKIDTIGNIFNRALIFNAKTYHAPDNYFGINKIEGRLTQVLWFTIEEKKECDITSIEDIIKPVYPCEIHPRHYCDFIVIDNFYENPLQVREFALNQEFNVYGNFPGKRTKPFYNREVIHKINTCLHQYGINLNNVDHEYFGCFQYTLDIDKSWVHIDGFNDWAGIIYLTPDAPISSGTTFYEFHNKFENIDTMNEYSQDMTKWKEIDIVGNIFNRFILFNSKRYHMSRDYFGKDINDGRLFQVFFI
jgi:hypothetical protein